ncbi:rCG53604 [Rattus norvegicus]|uniref:RCG53604 n=1 Tax=Rattus norvegicus TaxID=10116 RepID=A6JAF6_RAT|nr:rCG53604 [Rattus norvegicus]
MQGLLKKRLDGHLRLKKGSPPAWGFWTGLKPQLCFLPDTSICQKKNGHCS